MCERRRSPCFHVEQPLCTVDSCQGLLSLSSWDHYCSWEARALFLLKQLSSRFTHSIIWRLPPPTGQAEPAIGVATVEGDWGDKEVEAGGALVLRLQGICQLACQNRMKHYIGRGPKRKSHQVALFSLLLLLPLQGRNFFFLGSYIKCWKTLIWIESVQF